MNALNNHTQTLSQIISSFVQSELNSFIANVFNGGSYGWRGGNLPILPTNINRTITWLSTTEHLFAGGTGAQLQAFLYDNTQVPPGHVAILSPSDIIRLNASLIIPAGKTLRTFNDGTLSVSRYARFARLVRNTDATAFVMVYVQPGAVLENVFVDGSCSVFGKYSPDVGNVVMIGGTTTGTNTTVRGCLLSNSAGGGNLVAEGQYLGQAAQATITGNLITNYSGVHQINSTLCNGAPPCTDGITCACEEATVTGNTIVDATDVALILFGSTTTTQHSTATGNSIINTGLSAMSALCVDAGTPCNWACDTHINANFSGCRLDNNTILSGTGPSVHYDMLISVNTRAWFGANTPTIDGGTVSGNTTLNPARCNVGILVSDIMNGTIKNNLLQTKLQVTDGLPKNEMVLLNPSNRSLQSLYNDIQVSIDGSADTHTSSTASDGTCPEIDGRFGDNHLTITQQPSNVSACPGNWGILSVVDGDAGCPLAARHATYQWFFGSSAVSGANYTGAQTSSLSILAVPNSSVTYGNYYCLITYVDWVTKTNTVSFSRSTQCP